MPNPSFVPDLRECFAIGLGGALGANARYWLGTYVTSLSLTDRFPNQTWLHHFPVATLLINISGSLLLILLSLLLEDRLTKTWLLFLGTGFCGGYTTFSTFEVETFRMVEKGYWISALIYVSTSVIGGFVAVVVLAKAVGPIEISAPSNDPPSRQIRPSKDNDRHLPS